MKKILFVGLLLAPLCTMAQRATQLFPGNENYAGLEKNLLFYADQRFTVTQTGPGQFNLPQLFDGRYDPTYTNAPSVSNPIVITISGFPVSHAQRGAYVGWSTRYWASNNFKIEAYNLNTGSWTVVANEPSFSGVEYAARVDDLYSQLRFTFYGGSGPDGNIGLSELFFVHNEMAQAYDGLLVRYNSNGYVDLGTNARPCNMSVNGNVTTKKVKVTQQGWADFVFEDDYALPALCFVEDYIKQNKHLPGIPSAQKVEKEGVDLGDMSAKLLQKIEELTLYVIDQKKQIENLSKENKALAEKVTALEKSIK